MPLFGDDESMETKQVSGSNYSFSAKRIGDDLGASEYTLVAIAADVSYSIDAFAQAIEDCLKQVVDSCRRSPRADNLMLRTTTFASNIEEVHGYMPLADCNPDKYTGCIVPRGATALYDASHDMVQSLAQYGGDLSDSDYEVNGIGFVITDGDDTASTQVASSISDAIKSLKRLEKLESILIILIGVNVSDSVVATYLKTLKTEGGFDEYIQLEDADEKTLAKLASFVSKSISAQSQSLGSGGASTVLSF